MTAAPCTDRRLSLSYALDYEVLPRCLLQKPENPTSKIPDQQRKIDRPRNY
jgi:hypothetical protein